MGGPVDHLTESLASWQRLNIRHSTTFGSDTPSNGVSPHYVI
jgi:hypothetical protein